MAHITLGGNACETVGDLPAVGTQAPPYTLVAGDLSTFTNTDFDGQRVVLNIFPSVNTGVCAASVRRFNELAAGLDNTTVVCVSADLPFSAVSFCGAEGIENVTTGSTFRSPAFGEAYGTTIIDGGFAGLQARAVVVVDTDGTVIHSQLVPEIGQEPDYDAAIASLG